MISRTHMVIENPLSNNQQPPVIANVNENIPSSNSLAIDEAATPPPPPPVAITKISSDKKILSETSAIGYKSSSAVVPTIQRNNDTSTATTTITDITKKTTIEKPKSNKKNVSTTAQNRKHVNSKSKIYNLKWVCQKVLITSKKWYPMTPIAYLPAFDSLLLEGKLLGISSTSSNTTNDDKYLTSELRAKILIAIIWNINVTESLLQTKLLDDTIEELLNAIDKNPNSINAETQTSLLIWIPIFFVQYILIVYRVRRLSQQSNLKYIGQLFAVQNGEGTIVTSFKCFPKHAERMLKYVLDQYPKYKSSTLSVGGDHASSSVGKNGKNGKNIFLYYNYLLAKCMLNATTIDKLEILKNIDLNDVSNVDYENHIMNTFCLWFYEEILQPKEPFKIFSFALDNFHTSLRKQSTFVSNTHSTFQYLPDILDTLLLEKMNVSFLENVPHIRYDLTSKILTIMYADYMYQFPVYNENTIFYKNCRKNFVYGDVLYMLFARRMLTLNSTENNYNSEFGNEPGLFYNNFTDSPKISWNENTKDSAFELNTNNHSTYYTFCVHYKKIIIFVTSYRYDSKDFGNNKSHLFQIMVTHPVGCLILATDLIDNRNFHNNCLTIGQNNTGGTIKNGKLLQTDTYIKSIDDTNQMISGSPDDNVRHYCTFKKPELLQKIAIENCFLGYSEILNNQNVDFQVYFEDDEISILIMTDYDRTIPIKLKFIIDNDANGDKRYSLESIKISEQIISYTAKSQFEINTIVSE